MGFQDEPKIRDTETGCQWASRLKAQLFARDFHDMTFSEAISEEGPYEKLDN